jgi:hypothetical protein
VIVADVCVPPTTPEIVGAVRVTTEEVAEIPEDKAEPVPSRVYISTKLSLTLSPAILRLSPVPSFADDPIPIA